MQAVSPEYKESMKSLLRNRGYMRIEIGNINEFPQNNAVLIGDQFGTSNPSKVFKNGIDDFVYASLEENFTKVDGSKYHPGSSILKEEAFIGADLVSDGPYSVVISFGGNAVTFDTMIFNFGDNYPLEFSLTDSNGNTYEYENETGRIVEIDQLFDGVTDITLTVTAMLIPVSRLRIYSINFDYGIEFDNDMIKDSSLESSLSPINAFLPQMNFDVNLINEDHYFDIENPKSLVNMFTTSTEIKVYYGYQLSDHIEWLQAAKLYAKSWKTTEDTCSVSAWDILQLIDKRYIAGTVTSTSLHDLAVAVFTEMGITDYEIDPDLENITTTNPIPVVNCKEALQIIANAGCQKLYIKRDGSIKIGKEINTVTYSSNGTMAYSNLQDILEDDTKYDYAALEQGYLQADASKYHPGGSNYLKTGYVSEQYSDDEGVFETGSEPVITISAQMLFNVSGLRMKFRGNYPSEFIVKLYASDEVIHEELITNTETDCTVSWDPVLTDQVEIVFTQTSVPYNRVRIGYMEVMQEAAAFVFDENDIMSYPQFNKAEMVQKIIVPYYKYQSSGTETQLTEQTITVSDTNEEYEFSWKEPVTGLRYTVSSGSVTVLKSGAYAMRVKFSTTGSKTFAIYGTKYNIVEQELEEVLNEEGTVVRWKNPLIDSKDMAADLLAWLKTYYESEGSYDFSTRGNPELDVNDEVGQRKYTGEMMTVLITDITLNFNGAFSGSVTTLKEGVEA